MISKRKTSLTRMGLTAVGLAGILAFGSAQSTPSGGCSTTHGYGYGVQDGTQLHVMAGGMRTMAQQAAEKGDLSRAASLMNSAQTADIMGSSQDSQAAAEAGRNPIVIINQPPGASYIGNAAVQVPQRTEQGSQREKLEQIVKQGRYLNQISTEKIESFNLIVGESNNYLKRLIDGEQDSDLIKNYIESLRKIRLQELSIIGSFDEIKKFSREQVMPSDFEDGKRLYESAVTKQKELVPNLMERIKIERRGLSRYSSSLGAEADTRTKEIDSDVQRLTHDYADYLN